MVLVMGIVFGLLGSAYVLYGKNALDFWFIVAGVALIVFPFLVSGPLLTGAVGAALALAPLARQRQWI